MAGVPTEVAFGGAAAATARMALTWIRAGLADAQDWEQVKPDARAFLLHALQRWIVTIGGDKLTSWFPQMEVTLRNGFGGWESVPTIVDVQRMFLSTEFSGYNGLALGPALAVLSAVHPRMAPMVFHRLIVGLATVVPVYSIYDALEWAPWTWEYDPDDCGEITDIEMAPELAIPACLLKRSDLSHVELRRAIWDDTVSGVIHPMGTRSEAESVLASAERTRTHRLTVHPGVRDWACLVLRLAIDLEAAVHDFPADQYGGFQAGGSDADLIEMDYATRSHPAVLLTFSEHDQVEGALDAEGEMQSQMGEPMAPGLTWRFDGTSVADSLRVFDRLKAVASVLSIASRLMTNLERDALPLEAVHLHARTLVDVLGRA
ncbi:MAG: hypothetical protein JWM27_4759 [Gemmatimonadetes bacterium]|nr:hypothetical protein [Gemmatimonadota bacterium]